MSTPAARPPKETEWQRRVRRERERDAYIAANGNVCELCGNPPKSRGLSEDHDHRTKRHRGWVCFRCNRLMPTYLDSDLAYKLYAYLLKAERG